MAAPTAVNDQITDAITQANVKVVGDSPAMAMGNLFMVSSQALCNAAQNATLSQQQNSMVSQASGVQGVNLLYAPDTAANAVATENIFQSNILELIVNLKAVLEELKKAS